MVRDGIWLNEIMLLRKTENTLSDIHTSIQIKGHLIPKQDFLTKKKKLGFISVIFS